MVFALIAGYMLIACDNPKLPKSGLKGEGYLQVEDLVRGNRYGKGGYLLKGHLRSFSWEEGEFKKLPVRCYLIGPAGPPPLDALLYVRGVLKEGRGLSYKFKMDSKEGWRVVDQRPSFSTYRFRAKEGLSQLLKTHFKGEREVSFLNGLATGNFTDSALISCFGRLGLAHLMAISGFHFTILALLLSLILRLLLPPITGRLALALGLTFYALFIGGSASVMRAWTMALLSLVAPLLCRKGNPLNSIGVALGLITLTDPRATATLGFQFSFLCTAAILLFYKPLEELLTYFLPRMSYKEAHLLSVLDKHGYLALAFLRSLTALTLAVHLLALPLTLFYFQRFCLMGLVYNLFFPLLITLVMFLLAIALVLSPLIGPLGRPLFNVVELLTKFSINFASDVPPFFDFTLRTGPLSANLIALIVLAWLTLGFAYAAKKGSLGSVRGCN